MSWYNGSSHITDYELQIITFMYYTFYQKYLNIVSCIACLHRLKFEISKASLGVS